MANILILTDRDERNERLCRALEGWEADAVFTTMGVDRLDGAIDDTWRFRDIVLLDHGDPVEPRLLALKEIRSANCAAKVIVTGIPKLDEDDRKELIFRYLEEGAAGYLTDDTLDTDLVPAIQNVQQDGAWIEPAMKVELIQRTVQLHEALTMLRPHSVQTGQANTLTRRQQEVLKLLAEGYTNKEIADELYISVGTVKNHVHRILDVLRASSREQAAEYYHFLHEPSAVA